MGTGSRSMERTDTTAPVRGGAFYGYRGGWGFAIRLPETKALYPMNKNPINLLDVQVRLRWRHRLPLLAEPETRVTCLEDGAQGTILDFIDHAGYLAYRVQVGTEALRVVLATHKRGASLLRSLQIGAGLTLWATFLYHPITNKIPYPSSNGPINQSPHPPPPLPTAPAWYLAVLTHLYLPTPP